MNQIQFIDQFRTTELAVSFLQARGIIGQHPPICGQPGCGLATTLVKRSDTNDGVVWRCPSHKKKSSIRQNSLLAGQKITLQEFVLLAYNWSLRIPVTTAEQLVNVSHQTVIQWYVDFRDVCSRWLLNHPIQLGGPRVVVEINEWVIRRRKNRRGHAVRERWVFGAYDTDRKVGVLELVQDRSAESLLPLVSRYIQPGSVIHSDQWQAYNGIVALPVVPPYTHLTVNHGQNFTDPQTGACTNHVENFWKRAKTRFKQMNGTTDDMLPSHLDEFMWRQMFGTNMEAFNNLLAQIAHFYPV